ncbi:MAG: hypothetical protein H6Q42_1782 [Deltaproteobacteria bacterium]|nr:hypothetical protein [Deltaproteobacteria bacterium]
MDQPDKKKEYPFSLTVSDDRFSAFLACTREPSGITVDELKEYLQEQGIRYGLADDVLLTKFLREEGDKAQPFLTASGKPAKSGKNAEVSYTFEKDPLKIGTLREGGAVDFKDRGEIPQVKEGALLARKIPPEKGVSGVDVYGKVIPARNGNDIILRCGNGVRKSPDGLSFFAISPGRPELLPDGTLCVFPELHIEGDVGLETGHVRFDGFINVKGGIQEGFQVQGGRLAAKEIYKAEIDVEGDIVIDGGIIGAKIQCRGNLKTRYIHSSQIEALGDVVVEGEIINSKIETNGNLLANRETGKIFSSRIFARKGIEANQVGSSSSTGCLLAIGINSATQKQVQKMTKEIEDHEEAKKKTAGQIEGLREESTRLAKEIGELAQVQERAIREQRALKKIAEEARKTQDSLKIAQAEEELKMLEEKARAMDKPLEDLMDRQDKITEAVGSLRNKIEELDGTILHFRKELVEALAVPKNESHFPKVKVHDGMYLGTTVEGFYSSIQLKDNLRHVEVQEKKHKKPQGEDPSPSQWAMALSSLTG